MVAELQEEIDKVKGIIQPVHEKVQQALGSTGLTTLKHISSKLVENFNMVDAEVS